MPHVFQPSEPGGLGVGPGKSGKTHLAETTLSVMTLLLGLVAFVATFFSGGHVVASWAGALGFGIGLYSQYLSVTTAQRSINVIGIVAAFLGVALGIARGGFFA